jgi:hypothetical protein
MKRKQVAGVGILTLMLLILGSLNTVVGYHLVQVPNQAGENNAINQREILFQTILDIANNKEIQRIILKSQLMNGKILDSNVQPHTALTKNQLKQMYFTGLILSKYISKSRIQPMNQQDQFRNQEMQKELSIVIEKNPLLKGDVSLLSNSECDCENAATAYWQFPVLCILLFPIYIVSFMSLLLIDELSYIFNFQIHPICLSVILLILLVYAITNIISTVLNCPFIYTP